MKKILLVEDDRFLSKLLSSKLKKENFDVVNVFDGEEALEKIKKEEFDLIILDLILPKMDGFEVLEQMRETSQSQKTPVLILSCLGQEADMSRGLQLGARDYIIKAHHSLPEVMEKIKSFLI